MKKPIDWRLSLMPLVVFLAVPANSQPDGDAVAKVRKLLAAHGEHVAVSIRDPSGGAWIDYHGDQAMAPASVAKTVTTSCSLDELGPQYQFDTDFLFSGKLKGDVLEGDLVIKGNGDPGFMIEDLHEVIEKIRHLHGIRKITGQLVFDNSYLGQRSISFGEGFEGDEGRSFTALITPTAINQNSFSIWVTPDLRDGVHTRAVALPFSTLDLNLTNGSKVGSATDVSVSYDMEHMRASVHGSMRRDAEPKGIYRSVDDGYSYTLKMIHRLWLESGGEWKDPQVKVSLEPVKAQLLWRNQSKSLAKQLQDINKFSLNLGAEMVFLAAGQHKYGPPAAYDKSLKLLANCLQTRGIENGGVVLTNGSGLSREAKIKPSALTSYLRSYLSSPFAPEYLSSFGLSGLDGTVKARLRNFPGRARLKTGSLKNVRAIAGYLYSQDHKVYTFAMIQNGVNPNSAKELEDQVLDTFLNSH